MSNITNNNCVEWRLDHSFPAVTLRDKRQVMKLLFFFCLILVLGLLGSSLKKSSSTIVEKPPIILKDTIDFASQVQPILVKNCSPCHFTGGKMYERMPFDKDTTIINHEKGILKRIKEDENAVIKIFIEQNKIR